MAETPPDDDADIRAIIGDDHDAWVYEAARRLREVWHAPITHPGEETPHGRAPELRDSIRDQAQVLYGEGHSMRDIGATLGVSYGTVRNALHER